MAVIEILTYLVNAQDIEWLTPDAETWLGEEDFSRWQRFKVPQPRDTHLASRFLLRQVLAQRMGCLPHELEFERGAYGKPFVRTPVSTWRFNLSHSQDCIVLAVADDLELGVDIEQSKTRIALADLAERVLSAEELTAYDKLSGAERDDFFFRAWVLKESYVKLMGTGVWDGLSSVLTDTFAPGYPGHLDIRAHFLAAPPGFKAALAFCEGAEPVAIEQRQVPSLRDLMRSGG